MSCTGAPGSVLHGTTAGVVSFRSLDTTITLGIVSAIHRNQQTYFDCIQTDASVNPGNSGGPLVTMDGEVVGIVTAILNPSHERFFIGIGFAVPIENAAAAAGMPPF